MADLATPDDRRCRTGADVAGADGWSMLTGQRLASLTNPTGVLSDTLVPVVDALVAAGLPVAAVLGPEHGFRGTAQAGGSEPTTTDERTGVPVHDVHGAAAETFAAIFAEARADTLVVDLQDVGARFYTYIWTMYEAMIAAIRTGLRMVVLDRPNPVGGAALGPVLQHGFESAVGGDRIGLAHGLTVGELARFFDGECMPERAGGRLGERLAVVPARGWSGALRFADTGLPWVSPSPNMPTPDTALLYPGTGLFEATNLSEGRGTTRPFELIGAPWLDHRWAARLNRCHLPGVVFREVAFTPTFGTHAGRRCVGVQVHPTDPRALDPLRVATEMLVALRDLYDDFSWRTDEADRYPGRWLDLLTGSDRFRTQLAAGATAAEIVAGWTDERTDFDQRRRPYLLYPRDM